MSFVFFNEKKVTDGCHCKGIIKIIQVSKQLQPTQNGQIGKSISIGEKLLPMIYYCLNILKFKESKGKRPVKEFHRLAPGDFGDTDSFA